MSEAAAAPRRSRGRRAADGRLRAIIEQLADGVVIVDGEGIVRFVNPAAIQLFGRPVEELLGSVFGFPVTDGSRTEIDILRPGGALVTAELRVVETEWEDAPAHLVSLRDITERKQAEEQAQQLVLEQAARAEAERAAHRNRFLSDTSALLNASLNYEATLGPLARYIVSDFGGWCTIDLDEAPRTLERVAYAHAEREKEALLRDLGELFPPGWDAPCPANAALRSGQAVLYRDIDEATLRSITRTGEHAELVRSLGTRSIMALPLCSRSQTLGAITFGLGDRNFSDADLALAQDVVQRTALSISNARLYHQSQLASRAKSDFLAVMSHELRTPLNAITGYTDLLEAELSGPLTAKQKEQLGRIKASSRHLLELVEEVLTFSRMEAGREPVDAEEVNLLDIVHEAESIVLPLAQQKGLTFEVATPEEAVVLETDPQKVRQILLNLLSNAVKFTNKGGSIRLEVTQDGQNHLICVHDTGIGISEENLQRVFEPFWQVRQTWRREAGGTGLGLSVANKLARLIGGSLTVQSKVGDGTTFTLVLPPRVPQRVG